MSAPAVQPSEFRRSVDPATPADPATPDPDPATPADHLLAKQLAEDAGKLLMQLRAAAPAELTSEQSLDLKNQGDQSSHAFLTRALKATRPQDKVLSEEGQEDLSRLAASRVWIVDPLDGTREFGEPPRQDWAVHVALVSKGQPIAGAVALPAQNLTLSTADQPQMPTSLSQDGGVRPKPRVIASRSRPGPLPQQLVEALNAELIFLGSAGAKTMEVVLGRADIYIHSGGQYEWDSAAPVAVARAAGFHASRIDGSPLRYNQPNPYLPDLLVCRPEWANQALAVVAKASDSSQ